MSTNVTVNVFLNDCPEHAFRDYLPGHCDLTPAIQYTAVKHGRPDGETLILEEAFEAFNVGIECDPVTARYRAAGNRSLSVGDVVEVAGRSFVCRRAGWTLVEQ